MIEQLRKAGISLRLLGCGKTVAIRAFPAQGSKMEMNKKAFGDLVDEMAVMYASMEDK